MKTTGEKPVLPAPDFDAIPDELTRLPKWILWRYEWNEGQDGKPGKWDKIPYRHTRKSKASTIDHTTWGTFDQVRNAYLKGDFDGVGFVLGTGTSTSKNKPPEDGIAGVDLDNAIEGVLAGLGHESMPPIKPWAHETLKQLDSYTEISPSGCGLRVFVHANLPPGGRKKGDFEMYETGRYLTVTGRVLTGYSTVVEDRQEEIEAIHARVWPPPPPRPVVRAGEIGEGFTGDDVDMLSKAFRSKNGPKLTALYEGSTAGYEGASEADMALCSVLAFWVGPTGHHRLDALFRSSGLMRPKWDERHYADGSTYGQKTIERAISNCRNFYKEPQEDGTLGKEEPEEDDFFDVPVMGGDGSTAKESVQAEVNETKAAAKPKPESKAQDSAASWMVSYARLTFELWQTSDSVAYATAKGSPRRTLPVKSTDLRREIARAFLTAKGIPASPSAVQTAIDTLDALAGAGEVHPVHKRKADTGEAIYLDLGGADWKAIKITSTGWEIVDHAPVRFRRMAGMLPMPTPERGGSIEELRELVNVTEEQFPLFVAWLLAALGPHRPYPILAVSGEQGSAKSSLSRMARRLVDPATLELRRLPYEAEDMAVAVNASFVVAFDNISGISSDFSDILAMISTGGGFGRRKRHTDTEETIVHLKSPLVLNGIGEPATRPDLLDRCLMLHLSTIPEHKRQREAEVEEAFAVAWPKVLGALLDAVVVGLKRLPEVKLDRAPRMADLAYWIVACEPACPWKVGEFMDAYDTNRAEAVEIGLEASPLAAVIVRILGEEWTDPETREQIKPKGMWEGTAEELRQAVSDRVTEVSQKKLLPVNARALAIQLKRISPPLRSSGYEIVSRVKDGKTRWTIREVGKNEVGKTQDLVMSTPEEVGKVGKCGQSGQNPPIYSFLETQEEKERKGVENEGGEGSNKVRNEYKEILPTSPTLPTFDEDDDLPDLYDPFAVPSVPDTSVSAQPDPQPKVVMVEGSL